ncbi:hypothetical protein [Avibacterium volantium]|uniref:hypothetical protein n=1 Tax=Avibacterium volantium TaxID=762 RepID=UPI003BF7ABA7
MLREIHNFELYRYQIIPIERKQLDLFNISEKSIEELLENKNAYFIEAFNNLCSNSYLDEIEGLKKILFKKIYPKTELDKSDVYIYLMARPKSITMETNEFTTQELENWPKVYVIVLNQPDEQIIAIEKRTTAFPKTQNAISKLSERLNKILEINNLSVHINPIYDKKVFWEFVQGKSIKKLEFNLITPNMSNISKTLNDDLKNLAKTSNTARTDLRLNAAKNTSLIIDKDNQLINDLVEYSRQGGGSIRVQCKGARRLTDLNTKISFFSCDYMEVIGPPENIKKIILSIIEGENNGDI